jgi:hypothetical protein
MLESYSRPPHMLVAIRFDMLLQLAVRGIIHLKGLGNRLGSRGRISSTIENGSLRGGFGCDTFVIGCDHRNAIGVRQWNDARVYPTHPRDEHKSRLLHEWRHLPLAYASMKPHDVRHI